jgi:hypothetical protein
MCLEKTNRWRTSRAYFSSSGAETRGASGSRRLGYLLTIMSQTIPYESFVFLLEELTCPMGTTSTR